MTSRTITVPVTYSEGRKRAEKTLQRRLEADIGRTFWSNIASRGTANFVSEGAYRLNPATSLISPTNSRWRLWPGLLNGEPVFVLRWVHCRLHVFELMADYSICDSLIDSEAKSNFLELDRADLLETSRRDSWAYRALWEGREAKYYSSDAYSLGTRPIEFLLHSLQK